MKDLTEISYDWITNIDALKFDDKSVLIIGAGEMAKQYSLALSKMNIKNVTIISKSQKKYSEFSNKFKFQILDGGFEKQLPSVSKKDLVIVATPTPLLIPATKLAIECGQITILVEKPGSLYHKELSSLIKKIKTQRVRIAYNRLLYPSFQKLKSLVEEDGRISSCRFNFTEWIHRIPLERYQKDEYERWGISNSLHVISMAIELIGMPQKISTYQYGKLDWHQAGSIFVGSGISEKNIPFSYHADWGGGGRWEVEVITKKNIYRLVPLEDLYVCTVGSVNWEKIPLKIAYPDVKAGIAEEIAVMLSDDIEDKIEMVSIDKAVEFNNLAERIFGYDSN